MIDEQATFEKFGYYSTNLSFRSNKKIVAVCDGCGKIRLLSKNIYRDLCLLCSQRKRQKVIKPEFVKEQDRFIKGTQIDRILTIEKFKYDPINLKEKSCKKIIVKCQKCNKIREIRNSAYHDLCKLCTNKQEKNRIKISCSLQGIPIEEFSGFVNNQKYCSRFNESCKESNREKYNRECFICGKLEENNLTKNNEQRKLSVHHVDMSKSQGCNGEQWKLIPVCMSCHSRIHNDLWENRLNYILQLNYKVN